MSALLELRGLHAGHGGAAVVRDLDLTVGEGEIVALLGANGAGKTTTLLTISGFLPTIAGEVRLFGLALDRRSRRPSRIAARGVAHVPEDRSLFYGLTARENLRLGCRRGAVDIDEVVGLFPALESRLDCKAGLLSGGEQQMLALARALTSRPRLLMVDEMSLGLAPVILDTLMPVLRRIANEQGVSILLVEQHVELALGVADRGYVLSHGRLALEGSAVELAERRDLLEASYLGDAAATQPPRESPQKVSD